MKKSILLIIIVFTAHFFPFFIHGGNAYIRIHDNLEGEWVWLELLVKSGKAFDYSPQSTLDNMLNGQPRAAFPTGLSVPVLMIYLFGSYWGYLVNYALVHLIAFSGMYLMLRKHFLPEKENHFIATGVALCFSVAPVYTVFGISVAGLPLLLHVFLNMQKGESSFTDFLFILLFPFYTSLVWTGISAIVALSLMGIIALLRSKKIPRLFFLGIFTLAVAYALANFQMLSLSFLNKDFIAHRVEYNLSAIEGLSFLKSIADTLYPLFFIHYHVATTPTMLILLTALIALIFTGNNYLMRVLLAAIFSVSLIYGFYSFIAHYLGNAFPLLVTFKANRFIILLPLFFFLLLAVALSEIYAQGVSKKIIALLLACQLTTGFFSNDEWLHNLRNVAGLQLKPGYREYFSENLFGEIQHHIGEKQCAYRVASIGLSPSIAQHNGFYTLDGLLSIYSLAHKKQFRNILAPELEKSAAVKSYFDDWGNRCYLFSSELGVTDKAFMQGKDAPATLSHFQINTEAFREMNGKYIFSAVEIKNPQAAGLRLLKIFDDENAWWRIYLYGLAE